MKFTLILTLALFSTMALAQRNRSNDVKSGCESLASKAAEAIVKLDKSNIVDSRSSDPFLIEKSRDGKTLIFDVEVGGRVKNPYFKVTIEKSRGACVFKSLYQDQGRG